MATILLTWELGGGLGHCVKLAPLAAGLIARGHTVYFAARDVATAQKVLQNRAVKFLQSPCQHTGPAGAPQNPRTFAQVLEQSALAMIGNCGPSWIRGEVCCSSFGRT
jgi:hypothetical protein